MTEIRHLKWSLFWYQEEGRRECAVTPFFTTYNASAEGWWTFLGPLNPCDGIEAAKAGAQADFEAKVRECLV